MKKKNQQIKSLGISSETIRKMGAAQLPEVAGAGPGASNNGCGSTTHSPIPTLCLACKF